jgi:hypothetical protein
MGYVGYFYVESKSYELRLCDGSRSIKLTEWGRLNLSTVFLGEVRLGWLLKMMNELVLETTGIGACRDHRMSSSVMFLQKRMNKYGKFMEITEYGRGGRRSFVVIPEGREGQGWKHCIVQLGRLVNYMNQTRDTEVKKVPIQPREVVPGRTFAAVVEGKNSETGTVRKEEGKMGNSAAEINVGTVEKAEKGKEKKLESENHAELKWEEFLAMLNEGVINMKIMRDMLEDMKGKLEILEQMKDLGCGEKGMGRRDSQQVINGDQTQLGQGVSGPRSNRPWRCCSKTYYRKRYRAVALRKAARLSRSEQTGPEMSPEGSKASPEVRRRDTTKVISEGDRNHGLETTEKLASAREGAPEMQKKPEIGGGSPREVGQTSGKSHEAGQDVGQKLDNRSDKNLSRRSSPEAIQVLPTPMKMLGTMEDADIVGQSATTSVVREDRCTNAIPESTISVVECAEADEENLSDGGGLSAEDKSGTCVMETEEVLGVGNSEVGDEGSEDIIPEIVSNSWVVESCLEFYPKVGITCEGKEKNLKMLVEDIENNRQLPVNYDCYVNYDRGMANVQQGQGRGRGRFGVL